MKYTLKQCTKLGFLFLLFFSLGFNLKNEEVQHKIQVIHPGKDLSKPIETILVERLNQNNETLEFYITEESVICSDNTCKIVPVNIFWDKFGAYKRIELEGNAYLEKIKGVEFTERDYLKLDSILRNKNSALADYNINEIIDKNTKNRQDLGVDGVTGATIISIDESETIVGATLTCYTLWHWINGDVPQIIKDITAKKLTKEELVALLDYTDDRKIIAIEELTERQVFCKEVSNIIIKEISSENIGYRKKAFAYINKLPKDLHFEVLREIFNEKDDKIRFKALYLVKDSPFEFPKKFAIFLSKDIVEKENPKEINKLLDIFQEKEIAFKATNKEIIKLLDVKNFSNAHRSYDFLKEKKLTGKRKKAFTEFYNKNKERLEQVDRNIWSSSQK